MSEETKTMVRSGCRRRRALLVGVCLLAFAALALPQAALAAITAQSVSINGGAASTDRRHVTLTLSAVSDNGSQIWVNVDNGGWKKIKDSWPHNLTAGADGVRTVTVQFMDSDNAPVSASASIVLDTMPPVTGTVPADDATWHDGPVLLTFGAFTDSGSGVATFEYQIDDRGWVSVLPAAEVGVMLNPAVIGDGSHTVYFRAIDYAGNVEEIAPAVYRSVTRRFDTTPPDVSLSGQDDLWHADATWTLTVAASDPNLPDAAGLAAVQYLVDDGPAQDYTGPVTIDPAALGDGVHTFSYGAVDNVGNEQWQSVSLKVDRTAPVAVLDSPADLAASWFSQDVTLMFSATDPGAPDAAGVERVETSVDGGTVWTPGDSLLVQAPGDHSSDGANEVLFRAVDKAVTAPNTQADQSATVQIDTQAPVTVASGNDADWHATPVTVHLAAGDEPVPGAGVASLRYQIDDGDWTEVAGAETDVLVDAPADHSMDGAHTVRFTASDGAVPGANVESEQSVEVLIDTTAPVTSDDCDGLWHNSDVAVTLQATDAGAGVATTTYRLQDPNGTWSDWVEDATFTVAALPDHSADGAWAVEYYSVDKAGNEGDVATAEVKIDTQAPTSSGPGGYFKDGPYTITTDDQGSGVAATEYRVEGGGWQEYTGPFALAGASGTEYTIDFHSTDLAGNVEADQTAHVTIDNDAPVTTAGGADDAWHALPVTVSFSAVDTGAGVARIEYLVTQDDAAPGADAAWTEGDSVQVTQQGVSHVWMRAVDAALPDGNLETPHDATVKIDASAPLLAITGAEVLWHRGPVTLTFTAAATASGVDRIEYELNGGGWIPLAGPGPSSITLSDEGAYTVSGHAVSAAGVVGPTATDSVKVDKTGPVVYGRAASVLLGRSVILRWKATDNMSRRVTAIRIFVRNARGKVVKVFRPAGTRSVGVWRGPYWHPRTKGVFRYYVYAKDRAGNPQVRRGSARIVVR